LVVAAYAPISGMKQLLWLLGRPRLRNRLTPVVAG
jgi:hypothetical protein